MGEYSLSYKTKIVEITGVTMSGKLSYHNSDNAYDDFSRWEVDGHDLSEFLNKFDGKNIRVSIEVLGVDDESHLLKE